jgi:hypothetical protein
MKSRFRKSISVGIFAALVVSTGLYAQEFKIGSKTVQVHGFGTQGFIHTDDNNWLTMNTSNVGSGEFTDFGANASTQITTRFRVGAQIYDRNVGQLGRWHPQLDWANADYRFRPWLGFRGGKVKTVLGLYNDTQDVDSAHTFALMPQSVYPLDMRDATLSHIGGDVYGTIKAQKFGKLSYTGYVGDQLQSIYGGYPYLLQIHGIYINHSAGLTYGGDTRWQTPVKGLLAGVSYEVNHVRNTGQLNPSVALGGPNVMVPYWEQSQSQFTKTIYGTYSHGNLRIDSEYKYFWRDFSIFDGQFLALTGTHGWYQSAAYRVNKWFEFGGYYSHFGEDWIVTAPGQFEAPSESDPSRHIYDKVITARFDLYTHWYVKAEGHFMDGNAAGNNPQYPDGFYTQVNPQGLKPNTNALVVRAGFSF